MGKGLATIPKLRFAEPVRNLPTHRRRASPEAAFTQAFARTYVAAPELVHGRTRRTRVACAREIPVNGYGIADLVCVFWEGGDADAEGYGDPGEFLRAARPTIRAFEVKLRDWRRALMQAHRYRYFANSAVVVLPLAACRPALEYLDTFRAIHVGLWGFDAERGRVVVHHTPAPATPRAPRHVETVLRHVHRASKALPVW